VKLGSNLSRFLCPNKKGWTNFPSTPANRKYENSYQLNQRFNHLRWELKTPISVRISGCQWRIQYLNFSKPQRCINFNNFTTLLLRRFLQHIEKTQKVLAHSMVGTHGEGQFTLRPGKTAGPLDDAMAQRI